MVRTTFLSPEGIVPWSQLLKIILARPGSARRQALDVRDMWHDREPPNFQTISPPACRVDWGCHYGSHHLWFSGAAFSINKCCWHFIFLNGAFSKVKEAAEVVQSCLFAWKTADECRMNCVQVITAKPVLLPLAKLLDGIFWGHPVLLLCFVMIMCPLVMNVIQVRALFLSSTLYAVFKLHFTRFVVGLEHMDCHILPDIVGIYDSAHGPYVTIPFGVCRP